jgi:hypothetical protein
MEAIPMPALICILGSSPQQQLFSFFSRKGGNGFAATEIQTETLPLCHADWRDRAERRPGGGAAGVAFHGFHQYFSNLTVLQGGLPVARPS